MNLWATTPSPIGELRITTDQTSVTAVDFLGEMPHGPGESRSVQRHAARAEGTDLADDQHDEDHPVLRAAITELAAYFAGDLRTFAVPTDPAGTDFQRRVWRRLVSIEYGATTTYGQIAGDLQMTGHAARAVGMANGRNPIPIIIPCHRVVGAGGALTGYGGGMLRKQALLRLESPGLFS